MSMPPHTSSSASLPDLWAEGLPRRELGLDGGALEVHGGADDGVAPPLGRVDLGEGEGEEDWVDDDEAEGEEQRRKKYPHKLPQPKLKTPKLLLESVPGWDLPFPPTDAPAEMEISSCEVACDGRVIVGVGMKGTMVIWKLRQDE